MSLLSQCGGCNQKFTAENFPQMPHPSASPREAPPSLWSRMLQTFDNTIAFSFRGISSTSILITFPCTHIFHTICLKGWVNNCTINCPNCKETLIQDQVGKSYTQLVTIFLKVLEKKADETIVIKTLNESDHQGTNCTVCADHLPPIPITYNSKQQRLYHETCGSGHPHMQLDDLTKIARDIIEKDQDPEFKSMFIPVHPTFIGRFRINHPRLFFVGCLEILSIIALVFNRSKFNGQNRTLSVLGYPAYSTLVLTHLLSKAAIFILSSQKD